MFRINHAIYIVLVLVLIVPRFPAQQVERQGIGGFDLSPEAVEVAGEIKVGPLMERFANERSRNSGPTVETLALRQEIMEKVMAASLDVDSVNAVIDLEIEHVRAIRGRLQAKRDRAQNLVNVASVFGGGVAGVIGTAMQFSGRTANLGNGISIGGGAGSVVLSLVGIHQQGGTSDLGNAPRIISRFSGYKPAAAEEVSSVFPVCVWSFLNTAPSEYPGSETRRLHLMAKWQREGKLDKDGLLRSEEKLKAEGQLGKQAPKLTISEMDDVQAMLLDVSASVSLMKRDLSEILRGLATIGNEKK